MKLVGAGLGWLGTKDWAGVVARESTRKRRKKKKKKKEEKAKEEAEIFFGGGSRGGIRVWPGGEVSRVAICRSAAVGSWELEVGRKEEEGRRRR